MEKSETEEIKKDLEENVVPELHDLHPEIFEKVLEWATRKVATERRKAREDFVKRVKPLMNTATDTDTLDTFLRVILEEEDKHETKN